RKIRKVLVGKVLDYLAKLAADNPTEYLKFYAEFGVNLRAGVPTDFEHREKIAKLLRFKSSREPDPEKLASLEEYVARAGESQQQIYFYSGPDLTAISKNP